MSSSLFFCSGKKDFKSESHTTMAASGLPGNALAIRHCSSCHAYVGPELLPKKIWEEDVLPSMGYRLGIYDGENPPDSLFEKGIGGQIVRRAGIFPEDPALAREDWNKISTYYLENAPDSMAFVIQDKSLTLDLKHFRYRASSYRHRPPLTTMVQILSKQGGIVFGDGKNDFSNLSFISPLLKVAYNVQIPTTPVHFCDTGDTVYLTTIGKNIYPHDAPNGTIQKTSRNPDNGQYTSAKIIIGNLQRPVHTARGDLNNDGLEDFLVCEYGNLTGKLAWYENNGGDRYTLRPLRGEPGAIHAELRDVNGDGFADIIALMAQGDEGIFLYTNRGNGTFEEKRLLTFLPLHGSQYFELVDFNGDGHEDILYVCGDNADLTPILKSYHGLYLYINDGTYKFSKAWFYQLNGAYKALPRDYDLDGDLDIAAISFFPDYRRHPEESFVYLENRGNLIFDDYSFPEATQGRWIVMDAGDLDGDGDIDLALGSFVSFIADGDTTGLGAYWLREGPSVAILENTVR